MMPTHSREDFDARPPGTIEVVPGVFTTPEFLANWERWTKIKVVSVREAVAVSFGIEPNCSGDYEGRGYPLERLREREELAIMNLGPGGAIEGFGRAARDLGWVLRVGISDLRVGLVSFADWVLSSDMPLAPGCPRSPPASLAERHGTREQQTRACVVGMLSLALYDRLIRSSHTENRVKVSAVRDAVLHSVERRNDLKGVKRASLDKYIKEGLEALKGDWPR